MDLNLKYGNYEIIIKNELVFTINSEDNILKYKKEVLPCDFSKTIHIKSSRL